MDGKTTTVTGLRLGASAFDGLYRGLWHGRARRWLRET